MNKRGRVKKIRYITIWLVILIFALLGSIYLTYPKAYKQLVEENADRYGLDPLLVYAIIKTESGFDENAISRSGAKGLMQIIDKTGEWGAEICAIQGYTPEMLLDPRINIQIGCWYIKKLIDQYEGDINTALAAYNAGSGNVAKWKNNTQYSSNGKTIHTIPFKETENYIKRVKFRYKVYKCLYKN